MPKLLFISRIPSSGGTFDFVGGGGGTFWKSGAESDHYSLTVALILNTSLCRHLDC